MIEITDKKYYTADDVMKMHPILFKGCNHTRSIITKKEISDDMYTFAAFKNGEWHVTDGKSRKYDKLLLNKEWVNEQVKEDQPAPEIIYLKKSEKFRDEEDNIIEIETRGERHFEKCYFKVKDVADGFGMKKLKSIIIDKRGAFEIEHDYKRFIIDGDRVLFLSYTGLLRVLFACHNRKANVFMKWATKTLFTAHLGTPEQKTVLASKMMGVTADVLKAVFNKSTTTMPCIYLINLGAVCNLRKILKIDKRYTDDDIVYKYGFTDDLTRRMSQHSRDYAKIGIEKIEISLFSFVDTQYTSKAEKEIKDYINSMDLAFEHEKFVELAIIPKKKYNAIKHHYEIIGNLYAGHITEISNKMKDMQHKFDLQIEIHKRELQEETYKKELETQKKELEIQKRLMAEKDLEYIKQKYQNLLAKSKN